jgi:hypothetical protein
MADSQLEIPNSEVMEVIAASLPYGTGDCILGITSMAKVKGLDPHDKADKKRQNNLFSDPVVFNRGQQP